MDKLATMDAAGEVQRLLQVVHARMQSKSTLRRRQMSYKHFLEAYEDVTATFDTMAAVQMPLCLVLDAAVSLALALFRMGSVDLAQHVLRLKAPAAQQVLQQAANGELQSRPVRQDSCTVCARQQRKEEASLALLVPHGFAGKEGSNTGFEKNLHLMQAASGYMLLHATATAGFFQREDPRCRHANTRDAVLRGIESLETLLDAWEVTLRELQGVAFYEELKAFVYQAVISISRLCHRLASGAYSGTTFQLLNRCLRRVELSEICAPSCYWRFWWQLAQLHTARHEWSKAQSICCAASRAISAAIGESTGTRWRRDAGYKQLLFAALQIKCKLWSQKVQPSDAFEELQVAVKSFVTIAWPESLAPAGPVKTVHGSGGDAGIGPAPSPQRSVSVYEHLRRLSGALFGDTNGSLVMPLSAGSSAIALKRLLLSLSLSILQPEGQEGLGAPMWGNNCGGSRGQLHSEAPSNVQNPTDFELIEVKCPQSTRREESRGARKKRQAPSAPPSGNKAPGDSIPADGFAAGLLLKVLELADSSLADILTAASKLDVIFKYESQQTPPEAKAYALTAAEPVSKGSASAHDSSAHIRKKGLRPSMAAAHIAAGASGLATLDDALREAVRAAQSAAASLPLPVHAELLWRVADLKDAAPAGKLVKIWKALEYRFIYTNFFCPPLMELEVLNLVDCVAGGGQALQQLEEMVRNRWVVASNCDLESLQRLEKINIVVTSDVLQSTSVTQATCQSQPKPLPEKQAVLGEGRRVESELQTDEVFTAVRSVRLLLARYWDWENFIRSILAAPPEAATVSGCLIRPEPVEYFAKLHTEQVHLTAESFVYDSGRSASCVLTDLNNRLPLLCGVQFVIAESFEDAAAKYRAGAYRLVDTSPKLAEIYSGGTMQPAVAERYSHAQRVLQAVQDLQVASEEPPMSMRLGRRLQKLLQPLANSRVIYHGGQLDGQNSNKHPHVGLAAVDLSRERKRDQVYGTKWNAQEQTECLGDEVFTGGLSSGSPANKDAATLHILRLRSCETSTKAGMYQFLVYTSLSAGFSSTAEIVLRKEHSCLKVPPIHGCDGIQAPRLSSEASDMFRWRGRNGPRSVLQSCLGVHVDAVCTAQDSAIWPTPPLPHFNCLLQAQNSFLEGESSSRLAMWTETEAELPLCVLSVKLHTWSLLNFLDAVGGGRDEEQEHEALSLGGTSTTARPSCLLSAEGMVRARTSVLSPSQGFRLHLLLDVMTVLTNAFAVEGLEELMKDFANDYLCHLLLRTWHGHVLPLAKVLFTGFSAMTTKETQLAAQPSAHQQSSKETAGAGGVEADNALMLDKVVQLLAGLMTKCKFTHIRPLVAVATLLFHSAGQPLDQPKGRELLRGIIAQVESCASEVAMPFAEARKASAANVLLSSADPMAHLEKDCQEQGEVRFATSEGDSARGNSSHQQRQADYPASLGWEAEPAEAWCLLCTLYDIEAKVMSKHANQPLNDSAKQHSRIHPKHQQDGSHIDATAGIPTAQHKGDNRKTVAGEAVLEVCSDSAGATGETRRSQLLWGRNWYRKCLAFCATAESLRSQKGASLVASALQEASFAEKLEATWIAQHEPRAQEGALLQVQSLSTNSGQAWKTLYGGLMRLHGGLGVSRLQKDVVGTGLRLEPNEVVCIQALKESEIYVVAYEEVGEGRSSELSEPTLPLSCSWPLPLGMLRSRVFNAALRCSLRSTAEEVFRDMWRLVTVPEIHVETKMPKKWRFKEDVLARLPPSVLRSVAESAVCCFRAEKYRDCLLYWKAELVGALESLFRQVTNLELATFSESSDVAEQQLASLLNTMHTLAASLPSFPAEVLMPILRAIAATDALPQNSLPPPARAIEAALLGFACLAAAEFQVSPGNAAELLERFPPPAWILDTSSLEGRQFPALLVSLLLAPSTDTQASAQRLLEFARSLLRPQGDREEQCLSSFIGALFSVVLRRLVRQAHLQESSDVEELIGEAQKLLESTAPAAASALHSAANLVVEIHVNSAEPLVEWLCLRKASEPAPAQAGAVLADGDGVPSAQDVSAEARQVYDQGVALESRLRAAQLELSTTPKGDAALWMADLFALLMAAPMQSLSLYHRTVSLLTASPENLCKERTYGFFDFDSIAADAAQHTDGISSDFEEVIFRAREHEQAEVINSTREALSPPPLHNTIDQDQPLPMKTHLRNGGFSISSGFSTTAVRAPVKREKGSESTTAENEHQSAAESPSLCNVLLLLFHRGAAAASRAVAAGAPLLAYSVIVQLGNALLLANKDLYLFASCLEDSAACHADIAVAFPQTMGTSVSSNSKEHFVSGNREGGIIAVGKPGRRSESKGALRPSGGTSFGTLSSKGAKQHQPPEGKPPTASFVTAGVIAHACVELLLLVLRDHLRTADNYLLNDFTLEASGNETSITGGKGLVGFASVLEATEVPLVERPWNSPGSESANGLQLLCKKAFELKKINSWHIGAVFIFCIKVLLRRGRWHQVVALCRRFGLLGRGPPFRCALALGLFAQQRVIFAKKLAVQKLQKLKGAAFEAQELADHRLLECRVAASEKEQQETVQATSHGKRRTTRQPEGKADATASTLLAAAEETARLAAEATAFWEETEASMLASMTRQQQVEKWFHAQLIQSSIGAETSNKLLQKLVKARQALLEAKQSNSDIFLIQQLWQKAVSLHQKAVTTFRRQQQFEALCAVLLQLGDLSWLGNKPELADRSWGEAVEACFWSRNMLQDWKRLDNHFFIPVEGQIDIRLRSLIPLHRWASLAQRRSHHEQLHAALLASCILRGILMAAADHPLPTVNKSCEVAAIQFYAARSDGRVIRYRMRQLHGRLNLLPTSLLSATTHGSGAGTVELVEALLWFACLLRCCDFTRTKAFLFLAVAEYVAAEVCRNMQVATHCRIIRSILCIECGDLQASYWQLREVAWGVGIAGASLFERGEFPGTVFEGGNCSMSPAVPLEIGAAAGSERQPHHTSTEQRAPLQGFFNYRKQRTQENTAAREDLWNLKLHSRLVELYGATNVRRFTLAKASWTFMLASNLSAPHLQPDEVAGRLESLDRLESLLVTLLLDIIQETDTRTQLEGHSLQLSSVQPLQEGSPKHIPALTENRQAAKNKAKLDRFALQKLLDALRTRLLEVHWTKSFPSDDAQFALMLLSQVQEALGYIVAACEVAEAAALAANLVTESEGGFSLHPFVLNGLRTWQRVTRLLLRQGKLSAAEKLGTHLLKLASGSVPQTSEHAGLPDSGTAMAADGKKPFSGHEELPWLPQPPKVPGNLGSSLPPNGAICAPGAVVELLVLLAEVHISLGDPMKALRLCKWARHYAREANVDKGVAFADASLLVSQIIAECPGLLILAQLNDAQVESSWKRTMEEVLRTDSAAADGEARWQLVTILSKEALQQAERQLCNRSWPRWKFTFEADTSESKQPLIHNNLTSLLMEKRKEPYQHFNRTIGTSEQPAIGVWLPSALPVLHHLVDCDVEETYAEAEGCNDCNHTFVNLHDPLTRRRVALLIEVAEALQHQNGKTTEYCSLVTFAAKQLRSLGEPPPALCVRVWLHQIRVFRLQLEKQLTSVLRISVPFCTGFSRDDQSARALDRQMMEQLLRYSQMITQAATFVEAYCNNDSHLQSALFSEALLLSIQILASPTQLLLQSAIPPKAPVLPILCNGFGMLKKAALGIVQFCTSAFWQMEQQRHMAASFGEVTELDATLDPSRLHRPLIKLFLALHTSYHADRSVDETKSEDRLTCGTALTILREATRRCEVHDSWISLDRQLANCLHLVLLNTFPSLRLALGLTPHLTSHPFAASFGLTTDIGEKAGRSGAPGEPTIGKRDAKKDNKGPVQESQISDSSLVFTGALFEWLRKPADAQHGPAVARFLWLPPGVASAESVELLRSFIGAQCHFSSDAQERGMPASFCATVTSMTTRGHFTLALGERKSHWDQQGKEKANTLKQDLAVLVAIFNSSEVTGSTANPQQCHRRHGPGVIVCVKTCNRQRMQALATVCRSASFEVRKKLKALRHLVAQASGTLQADGSSPEALTISAFARIFVALTEGKRVPVEGSEEQSAFEINFGALTVSDNGKVEVSKIGATGKTQQQDRGDAKQELKRLASITSNAVDRARLQNASAQQAEFTKGSAEPDPASLLRITETGCNTERKARKSVLASDGRSLTQTGGTATRGRARTRKSIADFLAETSGIQHTSLETERSESYTAAARLLVELKKETCFGEAQQHKSSKSPERGARDKVQRQDPSQSTEESTTRDGAQVVAAALDFFSSLLSSSCTAIECKFVPVADFLCEALAGHQVAVFPDADENRWDFDQK